MKAFKYFLLDAHGVNVKANNSSKKYWLALPIAIIGSILILTVRAQNSATQNFSLVPVDNNVAACLPNAKANVTVFSKEDARGVDTLDVKAEGLAANTSFAVFLTEVPVAPFGATQYIGDFRTNAAGRGSIRVDSIVDEAFSSTLVSGARFRKNLNHVVIWFADPAADDFCSAGVGVTTPFDGDGQAGIALLSSKSFLPGAPLP